MLKHPDPSRIFLHSSNVGLLRCPNDDGFYIVATLWSEPSMEPGHYYLYTYDSRNKEWAAKPALLRLHDQDKFVSHCSKKVIVVGGKAGTMGWVDHLITDGILFCDVLLQDQHDAVPLSYITLPEPLPLVPRNKELTRDMAVVKGCIKYVELRIHVSPASFIAGEFIADGWTAATWSMKVTTAKSLEKQRSHWQLISKVSASQVSVAKSVQFELLPKLLDDQGITQPTLERLHTALPMISLHQDDLFYLVTKINHQIGDKAWVLAVDTKKKTLQGVAQVDAQRTLCMDFSYICSRISQHLPI